MREHGNEGEVTAQLADLGEHADQQVSLQPALVHVIEDDDGRGFQTGIREQAAEQDPRGDEFDQGFRARQPFPTDRVSDAVAEPAAVQDAAKAPGRRARGNAAWLVHDDAWPASVRPCGVTGGPTAPAARLAGLAPAARLMARLASRGGTRVVLPVPGGACTTAVPAGSPALSASVSSPARPQRPAGPDGLQIDAGPGGVRWGQRSNHVSIVPTPYSPGPLPRHTGASGQRIPIYPVREVARTNDSDQLRPASRCSTSAGFPLLTSAVVGTGAVSPS